MAFFFSKKSQPPVEIRGLRWSLAGDWYYLLLRAPWWGAVLAIAAMFLFVNLLFAFGYMATGGVHGARPDSLLDLFFFSVQTMGTIGYGSMYPVGLGAHILSTFQALVGILVIAVSTGVVFAKFSVMRPRARFANVAVITPYDGVPTLMFRIGTERASPIIDVTMRLVMTRTEHTKEGVSMYRAYDLKLERDHAPVLSRAWMILHRITAESPLYGSSPASFVKDEIEFMVTLNGADETSGQTLHARKTYHDHEVRWGARYADMLSERPDGVFVVDMACFDQIIATEPRPSFPYPVSSTPA